MFEPKSGDPLPDAARRYLARAVAPDAPSAPAVRLRMRGEIRLKGRWMPFSAEQWLAPRRGFHWRARMRSGLMGFSGFDRYLDGRGEMRWRLFGLIPVVRADGPDIDRSARGRVVAEAAWVPSALLPERGVAWSGGADGWLRARWSIDGVEDELRLDVDPEGRLRRVATTRWGNPDGAGWRELPFGGEASAEASFGGLTIPTQLSGGWWPGTARYAEEGEFIRLTIEDLVPLETDEPPVALP